MKKEFVIYKGKFFTLEWYFNSRGKSAVLEYFNELSLDRKKKLLKLIETMGDVGQIFNKEKFRNEGDQIYAFKPVPDRFLCFFVKGSKIIITNAFEKKTDKLSPTEKDKALKFRDDYLNRVDDGSYYDQKN